MKAKVLDRLSSVRNLRLKTASRSIAVLSLGLMMAWPAIISAAPPADPQEQSVPVQLKLIREYLVEMEGRLSGQMTEMETNLQNLVGDVQSGVDLSNAKLDVLQATSDDIWGAVSTVNVDVTTQICLDESIGIAIDTGAHGKLGAGWDEVLDVEANFDINAVLAGSAALGGQICIQIPSLRITSYEPIYGGDYLEALNEIIVPMQDSVEDVLNGLTVVYNELVPTPAQAMQSIDRISDAVTNNPEYLLMPDYLLEPITPAFIDEFAAQVPLLAQEFVLDPCWAINSVSPFGQILDEGDPAVNWLCGVTGDVLLTTINGINTSVNTVKGWVDTMYDWVKAIFDWLPV